MYSIEVKHLNIFSEVWGCFVRWSFALCLFLSFYACGIGFEFGHRVLSLIWFMDSLYNSVFLSGIFLWFYLIYLNLARHSDLLMEIHLFHLNFIQLTQVISFAFINQAFIIPMQSVKRSKIYTNRDDVIHLHYLCLLYMVWALLLKYVSSHILGCQNGFHSYFNYLYYNEDACIL